MVSTYLNNTSNFISIKKSHEYGFHMEKKQYENNYIKIKYLTRCSMVDVLSIHYPLSARLGGGGDDIICMVIIFMFIARFVYIYL